MPAGRRRTVRMELDLLVDDRKATGGDGDRLHAIVEAAQAAARALPGVTLARTGYGERATR